MIIFNAFKLWAGTEELKKIYVDIIYKCAMVIVIMHIYVPVCRNLLNFAVDIGLDVSGARSNIEMNMTAFATTASNGILKSQNEVINRIMQKKERW